MPAAKTTDDVIGRDAAAAGARPASPVTEIIACVADDQRFPAVVCSG